MLPELERRSLHHIT